MSSTCSRLIKNRLVLQSGRCERCPGCRGPPWERDGGGCAKQSCSQGLALRWVFLSEQKTRLLPWCTDRTQLDRIVLCPGPYSDFNPASPRSLSGLGLCSSGCRKITASQKLPLVVLFKQ